LGGNKTGQWNRNAEEKVAQKKNLGGGRQKSQRKPATRKEGEKKSLPRKRVVRIPNVTLGKKQQEKFQTRKEG